MSVPGDKSISHRALMLSGIAEGVSDVDGFLAGEDCLASLAAMRALGVGIEQPSATRVLIHGVGLHGLKSAGRPLDMGNAGTAMRLFTGLLSAQKFNSRLVGDASLMKRPMERVAQTPARNGSRCAYASWDSAGRHQRRSGPARDRLSNAGRQRPGQIGDFVGGFVCAGTDHASRRPA